MTKLRVAIRFDPFGLPEFFADEGVEVYSVCDFTPSDRVYRCSPGPIPDGLLEGPIGHKDDGSAANTRAIRAVKMMEGESHLSVVSTED